MCRLVQTLNQICQRMKYLVFLYKILDLLVDKKYERSGVKIKIFLRTFTYTSVDFFAFGIQSQSLYLRTFKFYIIIMWRSSVSEFSDEKNKTTAITSMCVIVCDPEDGYMNYELEMKQMFHKVAPFIYMYFLSGNGVIKG